MKYFLALTFLLMMACSSSSKTDQPTSGDGNQYTVVCRKEMQDCFERCHNLCPGGYVVKNRVRGYKVGEDTEYTVMIRCKREVKTGTK